MKNSFRYYPAAPVSGVDACDGDAFRITAFLLRCLPIVLSMGIATLYFAMYIVLQFKTVSDSVAPEDLIQAVARQEHGQSGVRGTRTNVFHHRV